MMVQEQPEQSYESLLGQLNGYVSKLERDETSVDEMTDSINKAFDLVSVLRSRLTQAEAQLVEVIAVRQASVAPSTDPAQSESEDEK